jgi:hypothetical protein
MPEASARFALPFLAAGQAQKEIYHNEALARLDLALHACVESAALSSPPAAPEPGQAWIVAAGANGDWDGREGMLAGWSAGGWRFLAPIAGMKVWDQSVQCWIYWIGTGWSDGKLPCAGLAVDGLQVVGPRLPDVPSPSGGTTIDMECRQSVDAIIATLKSHGLID